MTTDSVRVSPLVSYYFWSWILIGFSSKTPCIRKDASEITKIMSIRPRSYFGTLKIYFQDVFLHGLLQFLCFWMSVSTLLWVISPLNVFFLQSFQTNNSSFSCFLSLQKYIYIYFPRLLPASLLSEACESFFAIELALFKSGLCRILHDKRKKKTHITYSYLSLGKMCVSSTRQVFFIRQLLLH